MASDNLDCVEPWALFRPPFATDPFFSVDPLSFACDFDTLITKALTGSVSSADYALSDILAPSCTSAGAGAAAEATSPSLSPSPNPDTPRGGGAHSITVSGSGSDPEIVSKRKTSVSAGPANGRVGKKKSRPSKKSPTTFITADAANFRHMVQQVTGVKLPSSGRFPSTGPVLKPEPQRIGSAAGAVHGCLPTLDTSAFLLDHHHEQAVDHGAASLGFAPPPVADRPTGDAGGRTGLDFDSFACFPTLESWKVM